VLVLLPGLEEFAAGCSFFEFLFFDWLLFEWFGFEPFEAWLLDRSLQESEEVGLLLEWFGLLVNHLSQLILVWHSQ
jgi:hypothetical protein